MSRYAVFVKIFLDADNKKDAREIVEAELEESVRLESAEVQNVKEVEDEESEEGDDLDDDLDL